MDLKIKLGFGSSMKAADVVFSGISAEIAAMSVRLSDQLVAETVAGKESAAIPGYDLDHFHVGQKGCTLHHVLVVATTST